MSCAGCLGQQCDEAVGERDLLKMGRMLVISQIRSMNATVCGFFPEAGPPTPPTCCICCGGRAETTERLRRLVKKRRAASLSLPHHRQLIFPLNSTGTRRRTHTVQTSTRSAAGDGLLSVSESLFSSRYTSRACVCVCNWRLFESNCLTDCYITVNNKMNC